MQKRRRLKRKNTRKFCFNMDDTKKWFEAVFNDECQLNSFLLRFPRPELFSESPVGTLKEF